jgi:pimeloyl-ACP methyl ester carboxylesterase
MEQARFVDRPDGVRIGYRLWREAPGRPLLVLIHGLASNLTRWSEFVEFTILKQSWDILRIDLRGHGTSLTRGRIGMEYWCDDLAAVLDKEGYARAVILGHSLGAQVGMFFHDQRPERVAGLIMIDPVFPQNLTGNLRTAKRFRWGVWLAIRIIWVLNAVGFRRRHFPPRDLRELDERTRETLASDPSADIGKLYTKPRIDLDYIPVANYMQDMLEVTRPLPPLERIKVPVLVLLSAGATVSHPERNLAMIRRMPHAEIETIEANHWLMTERPVEAREAIERWCLALNSRATD